MSLQRHRAQLFWLESMREQAMNRCIHIAWLHDQRKPGQDNSSTNVLLLHVTANCNHR
jgi:hypothetical protein